MKFLQGYVFDNGIGMPFASGASSSSSRVSIQTGAAESSARSTRLMCGTINTSSSTILAENITNDCDKRRLM
ncbi:MAG TPA: hypothetical protein VEG44_03140 [Candidatus Acidoferrales bacterium]|nr:hypothetical protein [Candidatus Acidoferrales bacterium]